MTSKAGPAEPDAGRTGVSSMDDTINVRSDVLNQLEHFLENPKYRDEIIETSSSYNQKLVRERKLRLPFLDSQTGVAQGNCHLWMRRCDRLSNPHPQHGHVFTYPARRWHKRHRQYLLDDNYLLRTHYFAPSAYINEASSQSSSDHQLASPQREHTSNNVHIQPNHHFRDSSSVSQGNPQLNALLTDNPIDSPSRLSFTNRINSATSSDLVNHHLDSSSDSLMCADPNSNGKQTSMHPWSSHSEFSRGLLNNHDDSMDYTDALTDESNDGPRSTPRPKKSKKDNANATPKSSIKKPPRERKSRRDLSDEQLPFKCQACGLRYKSSAGYTYHRKHCRALTAANKGSPQLEDGDSHSNSFTSNGRVKSEQSNSPSHSGPCDRNFENGVEGSKQTRKKTKIEGDSTPNPYCDFCLGDANENKKTKQSEELVSCSDCGRSGHPSCLKFTENMITSVKKYKWQCIECKSCAYCGTSENDDKLFLCDDCDRGYHMYCLNPPLFEHPEGSWSCDLCVAAFKTVVEPTDQPKPTSLEPILNGT